MDRAGIDGATMLAGTLDNEIDEGRAVRHLPQFALQLGVGVYDRAEVAERRRQFGHAPR